MARLKKLTLVVLSACLVCAGGCQPAGAAKPKDEFFMQPLPVQQLQAYPETVTGRFTTLADFEDSTLLRQRGERQVEQFAIEPAGAGQLSFTDNVTRTGIGAMRANLPAGAQLVYRPAVPHDFSGYTLLQLALHSTAIRDDLRVKLVTDKADWESHHVLLRAGWNNVLIDLQRLAGRPDFDAKAVKEIRLWFSAADNTTEFGLDDMMLIDNRREIPGTPPGVKLTKFGLDYKLELPGLGKPLELKQGEDGLWRLGEQQTLVDLTATPSIDGVLIPASRPATTSAGPREQIDMMGKRRLGEVEVLEANALRLRLASTWYFPDSAGQWESLAVRQIRWEYTFYADGRWVTDITLNNAGGESISSVVFWQPEKVAWSDGELSAAKVVSDFAGSAGRWSFIRTGRAERRSIIEAGYLRPPAVKVTMGQIDPSVGDADGDGFDQSQGCYCLKSAAGNCRFSLALAQGPMDVYVRVRGKWTGAVTASCQGLSLRSSVRLADGSLLLAIPAVGSRPVAVEVTGPVELLDR